MLFWLLVGLNENAADYSENALPAANGVIATF